MSTDGKEPGAVWYSPDDDNSKQPPAPGRSRPLEQDDPAFDEQVPPLPLVVPEDDFPQEVADYPQEEINENIAIAPSQPVSTPFELLRQLGQYVTLIVVPLLFGALTCLFVLPAIAMERAAVSPAGLWPVTIAIILVAVGQGVAVYYAGSNNGLWAVATIGGFFLFLLVGCFALFGLLPGLLLLVILIAATVVLARYYVHPVHDGFVDIVNIMGKYSRTLYAGFNVLLPWEKVAAQLKVKEIQWTCPTQRVQLSHSEDVLLSAAISYQLMPEDAYLAVSQVNNWEESLHEQFIVLLQTLATQFTPDDFIAWRQAARSGFLSEAYDSSNYGARWNEINEYLFQLIRDRVAPWGVIVNEVRIYDVTLAPHGAVLSEAEPVVSGKQLKQEAVQPSAASQYDESTAKIVEKSLPRTASPAPEQNPPTPAQLPKEDVLIKAYKEVQNGKITDPDTIRSIAEKFEMVAKDPQASQTVSFDPARAALNLYSQARRCEEQLAAEPLYDDETKPEWHVRRPSDENLMAGG